MEANMEMDGHGTVFQENEVGSSLSRDDGNVILLDMSDVCCEVHVDESPAALNTDIELGYTIDLESGMTMDIGLDSFNGYSTNIPDALCEVSGSFVEHCACECCDHKPKRHLKDRATQTMSRLAVMCVEDFKDDPTGMAFYTGLENYEKFLLVFNTLVPDCYDLDCHGEEMPLSVLDQLFLTLMKLRTNKADFELAKFFGLSVGTVSHMFITWTVFMHKKWSQIDMWPSRQLINLFKPRDFEKNFPSSRVIIDCFEVPITKPVEKHAQHATFNLASSMYSLKVLVGLTPGGLVSFCSEAYGGSTSDDEMVELSGILDKCERQDCIIFDKKFSVPDLCASKELKVCRLDFKKTASKALGIISSGEKLKGKLFPFIDITEVARRSEILANKLCLEFLPVASEICYVCVMLFNFLECNAKSLQAQLQARRKV